ncbi:hypothetical protein [Chryseolinea sp. H1M3-3]|uniref:hypothetical protein n=1 Tax=Chryseolinea sp. H1M3-3 TaxID=3034144 RepID=UPI0023EADD30|nr:hypothetical protein [Chryseolinea sp. H1M3-3]
MLDIGLYTLYALLFVAVAAAIIFPLINSITNPSGLLRTGIVLGVVLVLFGISYALSGSELPRSAVAAGLTESSVKLIGAGLIMFYIVLILAVLALIYSEISKALK